MTTVRCPSCDAAVPADAAWCTLCFAQLGSQPAPAPVPIPVPTPVPFDSDPLGPGFLLAPVPAPAAALAVAEPVSPTWPCPGCEARVPLEEMSCPSCGTAFMGGVSPNVSLRVPGVGDLAEMSAGGRFGVMAAGAVLISGALVLVFLILGHFL